MTDREDNPRNLPYATPDPRKHISPAWPHRIKVGPPRGLLMKLYFLPEPVSHDEMPWVDDPRFGLKDD